MFRVFNSTMAIVARKLSSRWSFLHSVTALVSLLPLLVASPLMAATKTLNIYNWVDYISPITLKDFEKKFNAKINYDTYDSEDLSESKFLSGALGYDVMVAGSVVGARLEPLGIFAKLDKSKLPNWKYLDKEVLKLLEARDPGNQFMIPYTFAYTGFAYDRDKLAKIMPNAPIDSLDMIFKPEIAEKFAKCGISFLDSSLDIIALAQIYNGKDPNPSTVEELKEAARTIMKVRKYIRKFDSSDLINGIANKELCLAVSWSGDYIQATKRAESSKMKINFGFTIPKPIVMVSLDNWVLNSKASDPELAYAFLNFMLEPKVAADNMNLINYYNANPTSLSMVRKDLVENLAVIPTAEVRQRMRLYAPISQALLKERTKIWQKIKSGTYKD